MVNALGRIVGHSILSNNLKKLNKDRVALSANDCKILTHNVINAVSLFAKIGRASCRERV